MTDSRPAPPEWWLVFRRPLEAGRTHVRLAFRDRGPLETVVPDMLATDEGLVLVARSLLDRPPPPSSA